MEINNLKMIAVSVLWQCQASASTPYHPSK